MRPVFLLGRVLAVLLALALASFGKHDVQAKSSAPAKPEVGSAAVIWFEGACDASGAVGIDSRRFLLADDEDNVLRVYDAERGGKPLFEADFSGELGLMGKKRGKEADIEGGTRIGDIAYFLASHGRKSDGRYDPNRLVFFATSIPAGGEKPVLVGRPYRTLIEDMLRHPALRGLGLGEAAQLAPKAPGGLNLEGLGSTPDGSLLLGFRNPVPHGRALVVRLSNPRDVLDGKPPALSAAISLDLGGLGIRALSYFRGEHLIAAGASGDGGHGKLYRWDGEQKVAPIEVKVPGFAALNPEALFTPEKRREFLVLSDDGTQLIGSEACKKLKDVAAKRFRGMWVRPG
jgi:hypothetical protein